MLLAQSDSNDWGVLQVFWSMLWFFLFVAWIVLLIRVFSDIMRSRDLSGWGKAGWTIAILILPFLGVFLYLIVNGDKMNQRDEADARAAEDAMQAYIRDAAGTSNTGDQLHKLAALHDAGSISDDEFTQAKAKILG